MVSRTTASFGAPYFLCRYWAIGGELVFSAQRDPEVVSLGRIGGQSLGEVCRRAVRDFQLAGARLGRQSGRRRADGNDVEHGGGRELIDFGNGGDRIVLVVFEQHLHRASIDAASLVELLDEQIDRVLLQERVIRSLLGLIEVRADRAKSVGVARRSRTNQSLAPFG